MKGLLLIILAAAFVFSVVADFVILGGDGHGEFWWSHFYGFFAFFGFLACVVIIVIAKMLGGHWLQQGEDYYCRDGHHD
ncbi:MAG: hypothetical protein ACE5H6_03970 [Dehalococcoidia bacterium]